MKFETVLHLLMKRFNEEGIAFVLSGGLALSTLGVARFTSDIDFIIYEEDRERVNRIMTELGYERQSYSSNDIVCYCSPLRVFGQVDFLVARRKYTRTMMQKATEKPLFGGRLNVRAVRPEDLIGLKVQAICNDPDNRHLIDKPDIQRLLKLHRKAMDMDLVREYFRIFDKEAWLNEWLQEIDG